MNIAHFFRSFQNIVGFFLGDTSGSVCFDAGFGKLAKLNAPLAFKVFADFAPNSCAIS
jgi:hypothetical protein